jgi:hypothetical protein
MAQKCTYPDCEREDIALRYEMQRYGPKQVAFLCEEHRHLQNLVEQPVWIKETDANE